MDGQGAGEFSIMGLIGGNNLDPAGFMDQLEEEGYESRSGSENFEVGSGDEVDVGLVDDVDQGQPNKRKKYHRHDPQQIQQLES